MPAEPSEHRLSARPEHVRKANAPDRAAAELADRQHGVVSRRQLVDAGLTPTMIQTRLARGQLVPLHRGVYALGHRRLARFGFWTAAVLAAGPDAALSHRDAAALHGLLSLERARIDVTSPRRMASTARIDAHDRRELPADERTAIAGIPVTTVERTLVDLGEVLPAHRLRRALAEAERMRAADAHRLAAAMERTRSRRGGGHAALTAALAELRRHGPQRTRSDAEDLFLDLVIEHRLARPRMNMLVDGAEVDAVWPAQRVAVEVDGRAYHWTDGARERDRRKSNRLAAAGWRVLRFDWWEVSEPPRRAAVAAALRAAGIPHE